MNNTASKRDPNTENNSHAEHHFVWKLSPFVCKLKTGDRPLIWFNQPNNRFTAINSRIRGFTMIELVVTMIVAALVAAFVIPNIRLIIKDSRISTQINDLKADLNYARSEAVKRRSDVIVCPSSNGASCQAAAGNWKGGRLIFVDTNRDGDIDLASGDVLLRFREAVGGSDRSLKVENTDPVVFLKSGGTTGVTTFTICDDQGAGKGKQLSLSQTGLTILLTAAVTACN